MTLVSGWKKWVFRGKALRPYYFGAGGGIEGNEWFFLGRETKPSSLDVDK